MDAHKLFTTLKLADDLVLANRVIMSPMTRARSDPVTRMPTKINELYYEQRAGAGLLVAEATAISEQGYGWFGTPALYNDQHAAAWKRVVDRVHAKDGKIFLQLWHLGRAGHPSFNTKHDLVSASAIPIPGDGRIRDAAGQHASYATPRALETHEISAIVDDYRKCAVRAKAVGFDGVEVHSANGYLVDQFLQSATNERTDEYGGSFENRSRFLLEIVDALKTVYPENHIAVRLSPNSPYNGMGSADNAAMFTFLCERLRKYDLAYVGMLDGAGFGLHDKGALLNLFDIKKAFGGRVIGNVSYTRDIAEGAIRSGACDAIAFGRLFISNPDLVERFKNDWPLLSADPAIFWHGPATGEGYIDFPTYSEA